MATCGTCGSRVGSGAEFCPVCGAFLDWSDASRTPGEPATPRPESRAPTPPPRRDPPDPPPLPATPARTTPPPAPDRSDPSPVSEAVTWTTTGRRLAEAHDRIDLADRLDAVGQRLASHMLPVAVVGEFKRGKSTLVNALLQTSVCPVDADIVTAVPTLVRYGDKPGATAYREPEKPGLRPIEEPVALDALADLVSESGNPENRRRLRSVEVRLRHRLLRTGLSLVDTPGVGGLQSVHGVVTLGALDQAQGLLFVTDASQELTGPELEFLRTAVERCPTAACVLTKTDLHREWRRIADIDRGHLARAGLDLPVIGVSSFLRLRAASDPELLEESGFRALAAFLAGAVRGASARVAQAAAAEVAFVTDQLAAPVQAERQIITSPPAAPELAGRLRSAERQAVRLTDPTASWQQALSDGVQDLTADVKHLLQRRLRDVEIEADAVLDQSDPQETWPESSAWLQRNVALAVVETQDELRRRADALVDDVASQFRLEAAVPVTSHIPGFSTRLGDLTLPDAAAAMTSGGRLALFMAASRGATMPTMLAYGLGGALLPLGLAGLLTPAAPVLAALGAGIGGKLIRDERRRQLLHRQQQAKQVVRVYLAEVRFVVGKDCEDSLRATQRLLRDEFKARAAAVHASAVASIDSVARASAMGPAERARRTRELDEQVRQLTTLRARLLDQAPEAADVEAVPGRA